MAKTPYIALSDHWCDDRDAFSYTVAIEREEETIIKLPRTFDASKASRFAQELADQLGLQVIEEHE